MGLSEKQGTAPLFIGKWTQPSNTIWLYNLLVVQLPSQPSKKRFELVRSDVKLQERLKPTSSSLTKAQLAAGDELRTWLADDLCQRHPIAGVSNFI